MIEITYWVNYSDNNSPMHKNYHCETFETLEKAMEYYNALKVIYNVGTFKVQKIEKLINENIE
jgi:hypothetical protein